jgi:transposase-like protein/IS1 family transposase
LAAKGQVNCHCCNGETKKFGRFQNHNRLVQRYRCVRCGKTMSESQPLDGIRTDAGEAAKVIGMLCEGMGIRAISRLTGLDKKTILRILKSAGEHCARLLDEKIRNVKAEQVQADELCCFVQCRQHNTFEGDAERGHFFTFLSVDRASKLILNWRTAKRTQPDAIEFLTDLKSRVQNRFQLSTDGWRSYCGKAGAVRRVFGDTIDYATETKHFAAENPHLSTVRFGLWKVDPKTIVSIQRKRKIGKPDMAFATTSHCERTNLSVRLFNRRFTRLTLGYSKKLENLRHAVALFIAHFNFCRVHSAHGQTPAQAAGLTDKAWTIAELLESEI